MKRKTDQYLNRLFKTPYYLELSQIFRITAITVIASGGQIVRIELYRRILQALFSAGSYALLRELGLLAVYEILYCGIVRLSESQYAKIEGNILGQLLDKVLTKNGKLRSLSNCSMGANDRFSMASEDCCKYASAMVSKATLFADFVIVPCYIIYGCSINPAITAAITAISIFLSILNRKNKKKLYDCNQEYNESFAHWTNFLWKAVDNLEVIKVFLNKKKIRDEQMKRNEALDAIQQRRLKTYLDMTLIEESSDMVFTLFILCAAFFAAARKMILMTDILAMVESLNVVQKAIFALPEKLIQLHELESMADRISCFENQEEDIAILNDIKAFEKLTLKQVTFAYEEKTVLKDIDFAFEKGKFYIVAGASGCGKSTLLKVLSKLLPYRGNISWNQSELGEISRQALYKRLSYQGQNQVFLEDTIRENIGFQAGDDKKRYEQILERLFIGKIFSENQIDDTQLLSFRGAPLSSGESQMVSVAGVLYEPREVILLDEVFSALDPAKEQVFFRELASLAKEGKLIILVSHRLTNLEAADEILFMEEGRICEKGSLYDLIRGQGKFYEWYQGDQERSGI